MLAGLEVGQAFLPVLFFQEPIRSVESEKKIFHLSFANSDLKCNRTFFEKYLVWGPVSKGLTRPII